MADYRTYKILAYIQIEGNNERYGVHIPPKKDLLKFKHCLKFKINLVRNF